MSLRWCMLWLGLTLVIPVGLKIKVSQFWECLRGRENYTGAWDSSRSERRCLITLSRCKSFGVGNWFFVGVAIGRKWWCSLSLTPNSFMVLQDCPGFFFDFCGLPYGLAFKEQWQGQDLLVQTCSRHSVWPLMFLSHERAALQKYVFEKIFPESFQDMYWKACNCCVFMFIFYNLVYSIA